MDDVEQIRSGDRHNFRAPLWRGNVKEVRVLTCLVKACNTVSLKDIRDKCKRVRVLVLNFDWDGLKLNLQLSLGYSPYVIISVQVQAVKFRSQMERSDTAYVSPWTFA